MEWYEAAAFVNWLNTSTGHQAAYNLTYLHNWSLNLWSSEEAWQADGENLCRHKDAFYFLPSEDEWYKAAYHKNDGVTANYWDYAMGSNSIPDGIDFDGDTAFDAVFNQGFADTSPKSVSDVGIVSPYGTYGQNGNVREWVESSADGDNNIANADRVLRGGDWFNGDGPLRSSWRPSYGPLSSTGNFGFRVASIPEPSTVLLLAVSLVGMALLRKV
jgi:formylglycine-generating enzyme required for sulfatase activity